MFFKLLLVNLVRDAVILTVRSPWNLGVCILADLDLYIRHSCNCSQCCRYTQYIYVDLDYRSGFCVAVCNTKSRSFHTSQTIQHDIQPTSFDPNLLNPHLICQHRWKINRTSAQTAGLYAVAGTDGISVIFCSCWRICWDDHDDQIAVGEQQWWSGGTVAQEAIQNRQLLLRTRYDLDRLINSQVLWHRTTHCAHKLSTAYRSLNKTPKQSLWSEKEQVKLLRSTKRNFGFPVRLLQQAVTWLALKDKALCETKKAVLSTKLNACQRAIGCLRLTRTDQAAVIIFVESCTYVLSSPASVVVNPPPPRRYDILRWRVFCL